MHVVSVNIVGWRMLVMLFLLFVVVVMVVVMMMVAVMRRSPKTKFGKIRSITIAACNVTIRAAKKHETPDSQASHCDYQRLSLETRNAAVYGCCIQRSWWRYCRVVVAVLIAAHFRFGLLQGVIF
jgi:hypothetical protein